MEGLERRARARCARVRVGARARAVLADDVLEEPLGFPSHRVFELLVEVRVDADVRMQPVQVWQPQPLGGKAGCERFGARVG